MSHEHEWIRTPEGIRCSSGACSASPDEEWWKSHCQQILYGDGQPCGDQATDETVGFNPRCRRHALKIRYRGKR